MRRYYLSVLPGLIFALHGVVFGQGVGALVPYSPSLLLDKVGNEWFVEQNGGLQRNGSAPSMVNSCMIMQFGNQQFYCQQPMMTPDGKEIVLAGSQPFNGLNITRRIRLLEKEGGLRYVEEFANTTSRDLNVNVEFRHNFNGQAKPFISDAGRTFKDALEPSETGMMATPSQNESSTPALLFSLNGTNAKIQPRLSTRNTYQISTFYNLTVPAGQSTVLIHAIGQVKLDAAKAKPEEIARIFRPFALHRLTKDVPKSLLKVAANLESAMHAAGLDAWFAPEYWGVPQEVSDVLVLDATSRLKGRAQCTRLHLQHRLGPLEIPWDQVAALAGGRCLQTTAPRIWLRDGQILEGKVTAEGFRFTLINGAEMEITLDNLDRLVLARPVDAAASKPFTGALLETWSGERLAFETTGSWPAESPWGSLSVSWADVISLSAPETGSTGGLLDLRDGTRLRVLTGAGSVGLQTRSFGPQPIELAQIRQAVTALAATDPGDAEPAGSFVDLTGDQRLAGRITDARLRLITAGNHLDMAPASIRELRDGAEELDDPVPQNGQRVFIADLWGSGTVTGHLEQTALHIEGRGFAWHLPVRHLTRIVNPVPVTDTQLLRRIGTLIQQLGDAQWKLRERASTELREMGVLARGSLQEALKTSTDAEVARRIEDLLESLE